jgi:hypothetical protein
MAPPRNIPDESKENSQKEKPGMGKLDEHSSCPFAEFTLFLTNSTRKMIKVPFYQKKQTR